MSQAATPLAERSSEGLYKMEGFYRHEGGAKLLGKGKKGLFGARSLSLRGRVWGLMIMIPPSFREDGEGSWDDLISDADQTIP